MTANRTWRTAAAVLIFMAIRVYAHHSFAAEYDEHRLITISGAVSKFEWINPHARLIETTSNVGGSWGASGRCCAAGVWARASRIDGLLSFGGTGGVEE